MQQIDQRPPRNSSGMDAQRLARHAINGAIGETRCGYKTSESD
jgi:hypothetical protein